MWAANCEGAPAVLIWRMDHKSFSQTHIRHYGFTLAVASSFYEAMRVSLDRHHAPSVSLRVLDNGSESVLTLGWMPAGVRERAAWNNKAYLALLQAAR